MSLKSMDQLQNAIDVSHYQGQINWEKVKAANINFAMAKATEGGDYQDPLFLQNWNGMKTNNIVTGAYHYFRSLSSTPYQQVNNIKKTLEQCNFNPVQDLFAIDVEKTHNQDASPDQIADNLYELIALLKAEVLQNTYPIIYTSSMYWEQSVRWEKYNFSLSPLWIANWNVPKPAIPTTWKNKDWFWWQFTNKGVIDGISGYVDRNCVQSQSNY